MPKPTLQTILAAGLRAAGLLELPTRGNRDRRVFQSGTIIQGKPQFLFIGATGALRKGLSWSNSFSLTNGVFYKSILAKGQEALEPKKLTLEDLGL